jgi:hypothetical protein
MVEKPMIAQGARPACPPSALLQEQMSFKAKRLAGGFGA